MPLAHISLKLSGQGLIRLQAMKWKGCILMEVAQDPNSLRTAWSGCMQATSSNEQDQHNLLGKWDLKGGHSLRGFTNYSTAAA